MLSQDQAFKLLMNQEWRLSNLYKIKDKEGNVVDFVPNWAQKTLLKPHNLNIVLKARQLGACPLVVKAAGGQAQRNNYLPCSSVSRLLSVPAEHKCSHCSR